MDGRFAVYFAPDPASELWKIGLNFIGRDPVSGLPCPQPLIPGISPLRLRELTREPRHYGLHATLKPPFHLRPEYYPEAMLEALEALVAGCRTFTLPGLTLKRIRNFIALTPEAVCPELEALAELCVRGMDRFRTPPSETELEQRRQSGLSARQEELLLSWGYPYVLDEFQFHLTLTGSLHSRDEEQKLMLYLQEALAPALFRPLEVREVCVFFQTSRNEPFMLLRRCPLKAFLH